MSCISRHAMSKVRCFFFQAEDGIRDLYVTGVQTCALPISQTLTSALLANGVPGTLLSTFTGKLSGCGFIVASVCNMLTRSEERRVGKECRSRRSPEDERQKYQCAGDRPRLRPSAWNEQSAY